MAKLVVKIGQIKTCVTMRLDKVLKLLAILCPILNITIGRVHMIVSRER